MSDRQKTIEAILTAGVVAIVRLQDHRQLTRVAKAIREGGLNVIEFTMTTPGAIDAIAATSQEMGGEVILGAGTVLDTETARVAIAAGADFIVSPSTSRTVIETAHRYGKAVMPGAFTPTEIITALEWGADLVKLFPAGTVGPDYLKAVKAPLPQASIVPTGGITLDNAPAFFEAGAAAIAIGGELVNNRLVADGAWDAIAGRAAAFANVARNARSRN